MTVKPSPSNFACLQRRLGHVQRRTLQAAARPPPSRVPNLTNDDHLHALYKDLMASESGTPRPSTDLRQLQHPKGKSSGPSSSQTVELDTPSPTIDALLAKYAKQGNTQDFELFISRTLSAPPTEHQRDLHVKAHIINASLATNPSSRSVTQQFPASALAVLHQYEADGHFAPIKSYTRVISALFNVRACSSDPRLGRAAAHAQAWDLFAHMRYVAHPVPDPHLYALMIRACASFTRPEPERALDLWTEMRENGIKPTKGAYEAVIRVCGRAGPEWLGEGMRLAREMSEHYPMTGMEGRGLWCALLEGCKRAGDLKKARWILAEAVRGGGYGSTSRDSMVDAEVMTHMFHTYASYTPPFRREATPLVDHGAEPNGEAYANELRTNEMSSRSDSSAQYLPTEETRGSDISPGVPTESVESVPSFARLPPQTSADVVAETRALFSMILQERSLGNGHCSPQGGPLVGRFAHVELTPILLNAYLSVLYRHASIETSREAFDSLFNNSSCARVSLADEYTYLNALERCAIARSDERDIAARWAKGVWPRWEELEAKGPSEGNVGSFARLVEKAHAAMRRTLILSGDIDGALALLRSFVSRYPPNAVLRPTGSILASLETFPILTPVKSPSKSIPVSFFAKPDILSTRTLLMNTAPSTARPLVRLMPPMNPKDDRVPPIIGFSDVDLLHTRLAENGRIKDLGYLKWVCMAYAGALKKRRDAVLKSAPRRHEVEVD